MSKQGQSCASACGLLGRTCEQLGTSNVSTDLFKTASGGKIVCNLGVRDVFASRIRESIIDRGDFFVSSRSYRGRFVTFGVSYGFGKGEAMTYGGGRRY